jgi:hypothetical protein
MSAAEMLRMNLDMPWIDLEKMAWYLQLVQEGHSCPSLAQLLQFLNSIPYEHSRELFMAVRFLIETKTSQGGLSFGEIMDSFVRWENVHDDGPPPIPGVSPPVYSLDLWRLVKKVYQFSSSLRPVTRSVLSSRMMMVLPSARYGFYIRCVMHGSNPSLRLMTVSPGMRGIICQKLLADAAKSEQNCKKINGIFKKSL